MSNTEKPFPKYTIILPLVLDKELKQVMVDLNIDASEAFRRALALFCVAVKADELSINKDNKIQKVVIK